MATPRLERDTYLDDLRGFAMMWVILVHCFYWLGVMKVGTIAILKSFALFEMPIFFFVTGACSTKVNVSSFKEYVTFVVKRYKKLLFPYWIYATLCFALSAIRSPDKSVLYLAKMLVSWALPIDKQITTVPFLTYALWFVPVYLAVILFVPLVNKNKKLSVALEAIVFIVAILLKLDFVQKVAFYLLWLNLGMFYKQMNSMGKAKIYAQCIAFVLGSGLLFIYHKAGISLNMQDNKFPPNITFLVFSITAMALIFTVFPIIQKLFALLDKVSICRTLLNEYRLNSVNLFLYQTLPFLFITIVLNKIGIANDYLYFAIALVFLWIACPIASFVVKKATDFCKNLLSKKELKQE